jgi:hypothetical protein
MITNVVKDMYLRDSTNSFDRETTLNRYGSNKDVNNINKPTIMIDETFVMKYCNNSNMLIEVATDYIYYWSMK